MTPAEYIAASTWINQAPPPVPTLPQYVALLQAIAAEKGQVELRSFPVNMARAVVSTAEDTASVQYTRGTAALCFNAAPFSLFVNFVSIASGNGRIAPLHPNTVYTLTLTDWTTGAAALSATYTSSADGKKETGGTVAFTFNTLPPSGLYLGLLTPADDNPVPIPVTILQPGGTQQACFFYDGDFDWEHETTGKEQAHIASIPRSLWQTQPVPFTARAPTATPAAYAQKQLYRRWVLPQRPNSSYCVCLMANGMYTGAMHHLYYLQDLRQINFPGAVIDGPFGVARGGMPTSVSCGHNGGDYWTDAAGNSFRHRLPDGSVVTLEGIVDGFPLYHGDGEGSLYRFQIGDYDASVKGPRRKVNEWAWCWHPDTIQRGADTNAQVDGLPVHNGDVWRFWMDRGDDTTKGRLMLSVYRGNDPNRGKLTKTRATLPGDFVADVWVGQAYPPHIYELLTGLDPDSVGGMAMGKDKTIRLTQRLSDKIIKIKPPTIPAQGQPFVNDCKILGDLVASSKPPGTYGSPADAQAKLKWSDSGLFHFLASPSFTLAQRQAEKCIAPEDYEYHAWNNTSTWSSRAQQCVMELNEDTGVVRKLCDFVVGAPLKFYFLTHTVCRGSLFPRGTVIMCGFENGAPHNAFPMVCFPQPDGTYKASYWQAAYNITGGVGANGWEQGIYVSCVDEGDPAFGQGRVIYGDAMEGVAEITAAVAGDVVLDPKTMTAGNIEYRDGGQKMVGGHAGMALIQYQPTGSAALLEYVGSGRKV